MQFEPAVEAMHEALWSRFVDPFDIIVDYVGPLPTPEECRLSRPNGLSWGVPNENGAFFNGDMLDGALHRWELTGEEADRQQARRLVDGLMRLASVGETRGFIARGVGADGRSHFPIGSNDQTSPWLYGLWRYVNSDLPDAAERAAIVAKIVEVAEVLEASAWRTPCDAPPFDFRNDLSEWNFENASRLLWLCRMMARLTGDDRWEGLHAAAAHEANPSGGLGRLDICRRGMIWEHGGPHSWISANSVCALRGLWELEDEPERKSLYAEGLRRSVALAAESLPLALEFDPDDPRPFSPDWRVMNELWHEQQTVAEAVALAERQLRRLAEASPRRGPESRFVREPLFAAWVVSLCPEAEVVAPHVPAILQALRHFQYDRLHLSTFFAGELAWYELARAGLV